MDPLVDVLVHGQDTEAAAAPLAYVATNAFFGAPAGFAQLRLVATDTGATLGEGSEEVRGTTDDLLLVATGRSAGLTHLAGAGLTASPVVSPPARAERPAAGGARVWASVAP